MIDLRSIAFAVANCKQSPLSHIRTYVCNICSAAAFCYVKWNYVRIKRDVTRECPHRHDVCLLLWTLGCPVWCVGHYHYVCSMALHNQVLTFTFSVSDGTFTHTHSRMCMKLKVVYFTVYNNYIIHIFQWQRTRWKTNHDASTTEYIKFTCGGRLRDWGQIRDRRAVLCNTQSNFCMCLEDNEPIHWKFMLQKSISSLWQKPLH